MIKSLFDSFQTGFNIVRNIYIYIYFYHVSFYEVSRTTLCDFTYPLVKLQLSRRPRRHIRRWSQNSSVVILGTRRAGSSEHRTLQLRGM